MATWLTGTGCANNPTVLQGQVQTLQTQVNSLTHQNEQLAANATKLDRDNQELDSLLAQSRQQSGILQDQLVAVREQLGSTSSQLAKLRTENSEISQRADTLASSLQRRTTAAIPANNSMVRSLSAINIPGIEVRADGDVIRIEMPSQRLFQPGSATLDPTAGPLLDQVAGEILRVYPQQRIGVEGHTDSDPVQGFGGWTSNHQLSVARAMAVHDQLLFRARLPANQLFVVGHGANHPAVSNSSAAGKARNNRVELVIYPDRVTGR